jgi:tetratricopeptide (TPR) repeat protein
MEDGGWERVLTQAEVISMINIDHTVNRLRPPFLLILISGFCCMLSTTQGGQLNSKEKVVREVYGRIVRAIGDARPAPTLQFLPDSTAPANRVAWFDPTAKTISLEERAYDICRTTGADSLAALAFLLGHELAHYYKDHAWGGDFGSENADLTSGRAIEKTSGTVDEILTMETQADEFGGFFGHLAGYRSLATAPALLPAIYEGFHLSHRLNGYPTLAERKTIAERSAARLESFIPLYDAAERLLVIGSYRQAGVLFDMVARTFPSREVLANAGVARALEASRLLDTRDWPWILPFEIDGTTRLQARPSRGESEQERTQRRTQLLEEATALLEQARDRDPEYVPVLANLALVNLLTGDEAFAHAYATKSVSTARKAGTNPDIVAALQARALVAEKSGNHAAALGDMREAARLGSSSAIFNAGILEHGVTSRAPAHPHPRKADAETVGGIPARHASFNRYPDVDICLPVADCRDAGYRTGSVVRAGRVSLWHNKSWDLMSIQLGDTVLPLLRTTVGYQERTTRGIALHDKAETVHKKYGQPDVIVLAREGEFALYNDANIVFLIDDRQTVAEWFIFDTGVEQ